MTIFVAEGSRSGTSDLIAELGYTATDDPAVSQVCLVRPGSTGISQVPPEHKVVVVAQQPTDAFPLTAALAVAKRRFVVVAGSPDDRALRRRLKAAVKAAYIASAASADPAPGPTGGVTPAVDGLAGAAASAGLRAHLITLEQADWDGGALYLKTGGATGTASENTDTTTGDDAGGHDRATTAAEGALPYAHAHLTTLIAGAEKPRLVVFGCELIARGVPAPEGDASGGWARPAAGLVAVVESLARLGAGKTGVLIYGVTGEFFEWLSRLMDAELSVIKAE